MLRLASVIASLLFVFLLGTTILGAIPPHMEISLPQMEDGNFSYVDGTLRLDTSVIVTNNGYHFGGFALTHDITNFTVSVQGLVEDIEVLNMTSDPVDIPRGASRQVPLTIGIDLAPLIGTGLVIFEPANVTFTIGGALTTTRGLLDAELAVELLMPLEEPLISDFSLDFQNSTFSNVTEGKEWRLPYTLRSADLLSGNASAAFTFLNETGGQLGNTTLVIPLGQEAAGNLTLVVSDIRFLELMAGPQTLTMQMELTLPGNLVFTREIEVQWEPPGGG